MPSDQHAVANKMDNRTLRTLRQRAHALKPVVRLGQHGLTEAVCAELDIALARHELVKVKLAADDRPARELQLAGLLRASGAQLVQRIGHTATLWRAKPSAPTTTRARGGAATGRGARERVGERGRGARKDRSRR